MKNLVPLFILLILCTALSKGQTPFERSNQSGLQIYTAKTVNGTVVVNLPERIYPGETITGTVITEPEVADNPRKEKLIRAALLARALTIFGVPVKPEEQTFEVTLPENIRAEESLIEMTMGKEVAGTAAIGVMEGRRPAAAFSGPAFPGYLRSGEYQNIPGNFDGRAGNTQLKLGGLEIPVVAESPGGVVTMVPQKISGRNSLVIVEDGLSHEKEVSVMDLNLAADATTLKRGQQSRIHVHVSGLEGVGVPVTLSIRNHTPMSISMAGGNYQEWTIDPPVPGAAATFHRDIEIVAVSSGGFSVSASLAEPFFPYPDAKAGGEPEVQPADDGKEKEDDGICGNTWSSEWKDTGRTVRKLDDSEKTESRRNRSKCTKCGTYSDWVHYKIPEYSYKIQERSTTTCMMPKGHANFPQACHGTARKENRETRTGTALRYREIREGSCGCREEVRWTSR